MASTVIRGAQILNNTVQRQDLDTSTVGQAVVTKLVQGSGISLSSTGADAGTGDVTVSSPDVVSTDAGNIATLGTDNYILVPQSQIWSATRRVFQAIGNPTFEVDQRNVGTALTNPASGTWLADRYQLLKSALTGTVNVAMQSVPTAPIVVPGTNFAITRNYLRFTVGTAQASLAAGDFYEFNQYVEGPSWRELSMDVHSVSLLVRSSVAGFAFSLNIRDQSGARSLCKLCTIPSANTWTLITLPNIPIWASGGNWTALPGSQGYNFGICLACGTTQGAPANDTWQSGSFLGAVGRSNFLATVGATFDIAFIQHEPGALCTTPIDCPFSRAYDDALRYFQKSYSYSVAVGIGSTQNSFATFNSIIAVSGAAFTLYGEVRFPKPLARAPTTSVAYHPNTGAANQALLYYASSGTVPNTSTPQAVSSVVASAGAVVALNCPTGTSTAPMTALAEWMVDTGW